MLILSMVLVGTSPARAELSFCPGLVKAVEPGLKGTAAAFIRSYEPGADEDDVNSLFWLVEVRTDHSGDRG